MGSVLRICCSAASPSTGGGAGGSDKTPTCGPGPRAPADPGALLRLNLACLLSSRSADEYPAGLHVLVLEPEDLEEDPQESFLFVAPVLLGELRTTSARVVQLEAALEEGPRCVAIEVGLWTRIHANWRYWASAVGRLGPVDFERVRAAVREEQVRSLLIGRQDDWLRNGTAPRPGESVRETCARIMNEVAGVEPEAPHNGDGR